MRSNPQAFEDYAAQCEQRARLLPAGELKRVFQDLAEQWLALAATVRLIEADRHASDLFWKRSHRR